VLIPENGGARVIKITCRTVLMAANVSYAPRIGISTTTPIVFLSLSGLGFCNNAISATVPECFCYTGSVLIKSMQAASNPSLLRIVLVAALYSLSFWRAIKSNRGNRVIECGCVALTVFMVLIVLIRIQGLPEWLRPSLGALLLFLCLLTIFFLAQQTIRSLRRSKLKSRD
jgi:hypothetical protein